MCKRFLFMLIPLSMIACSTVNRFFTGPAQGDPEAEEQAVYSVLLGGYEGQYIVLPHRLASTGI